jgi:hypothetical protein
LQAGGGGGADCCGGVSIRSALTIEVLRSCPSGLATTRWWLFDLHACVPACLHASMQTCMHVCGHACNPCGSGKTSEIVMMAHAATRLLGVRHVSRHSSMREACAFWCPMATPQSRAEQKPKYQTMETQTTADLRHLLVDFHWPSGGCAGSFVAYPERTTRAQHAHAL